MQNLIVDCLQACTDETLLLFNEPAAFTRLVDMMRDESLFSDGANNDMIYHIELVNLLARLTEGVNVNSEIKCQVYSFIYHFATF